MKIKELRLKNNYSQSKIAELLNISQSNYSKYERNEIEPDIQTIIKLADIYHTTTDNILEHNVQYLIDKSKLNNQQIELFNIILQLNNINTLRALSYCSGLLVTQEK